jgi:hypothetical protein
VNERGEEVLFDLQSDPNEFVNRATDPEAAADLQDMRSRLLHKLINTDDRSLDQIAPY